MAENRKHRILLVNFSERDAKLLSNEGFNVELGYIGAWNDQSEDIECSFLHPPYEYDVYVYNSITNRALTKQLPAPISFVRDSGAIGALNRYDRPPYIRITFTGGCTGPSGSLMGAPVVRTVEADPGVSVLEDVSDGPFSIQELNSVISRLKDKFNLPVRQYVGLTVPRDRTYPLYHIPAVRNRNRDVIAAYGTIYQRSVYCRSDLVYIILPQLKDNAAALLELLKVLTKLAPQVFPDIKVMDWYDSEEFALSEERLIDNEIRIRLEDLDTFVQQKRSDKEAIRKKYRFLKQVLAATEDSPNYEDRLSVNVRKVLEYLGFEVKDIDAQIRNAIRKEDFWVVDGDFLAITEVTGTRAKNPKIKEFNDILGRMTTIFKRRELVPDASNITGLLILNYDLATHPRQRPRLYSGGDEHIVEAAKENDIGLLSTVDLYRIAIAVKDEVITRGQARTLIKQAGRIEFQMGSADHKPDLGDAQA